jgi:hypothetical protein
VTQLRERLVPPCQHEAHKGRYVRAAVRHGRRFFCLQHDPYSPARLLRKVKRLQRRVRELQAERTAA